MPHTRGQHSRASCRLPDTSGTSTKRTVEPSTRVHHLPAVQQTFTAQLQLGQQVHQQANQTTNHSRCCVYMPSSLSTSCQCLCMVTFALGFLMCCRVTSRRTGHCRVRTAAAQSTSGASQELQQPHQQTTFHHGITYVSYEGNSFWVKFNNSGQHSS